ncbi:MAG: hypothetical protein O3C40_07710 [Planctomycetota bacterium]|nr:hypothetical protein [Planctomycetota bacterium]
METATQTELLEFHQFVGQQVAARNVSLSPEQAVVLWRHRQAEVAAIREGLEAIDTGRTKPLADHLRELDERFPLAEDA